MRVIIKIYLFHFIKHPNKVKIEPGGGFNGYLVNEDYFENCNASDIENNSNNNIWNMDDPQNTELSGDLFIYNANNLEPTIINDLTWYSSCVTK